jgi:hypothetical protein
LSGRTLATHKNTPKTLAPASGWGTTREDRRASLEVVGCIGRFVGPVFTINRDRSRTPARRLRRDNRAGLPKFRGDTAELLMICARRTARRGGG